MVALWSYQSIFTHVLTTLAPHLKIFTAATTDDDLQEVYNIFSTFPDLPQEAVDDHLCAYPL